MRPLDYPGQPALVAGLLRADGSWHALGPAGPPPHLLDGRTCVVAVGSNASPRVLAAKLRAAGECTEVLLVPVDIEGLAVAHSAHVSPAGYVATTAYAAPGTATRLVASWFDAGQLAAVDATEPNYRRRALPTAVRGAPHAAEAYVSRWGVLAPSGEPLAPTTQREVHRVLARDPLLSRLLGRPTGRVDADTTIRALAAAETRELVRRRMLALGWLRPTGL